MKKKMNYIVGSSVKRDTANWETNANGCTRTGVGKRVTNFYWTTILRWYLEREQNKLIHFLNDFY